MQHPVRVPREQTRPSMGRTPRACGGPRLVNPGASGQDIGSVLGLAKRDDGTNQNQQTSDFVPPPDSGLFRHQQTRSANKGLGSNNAPSPSDPTARPLPREPRSAHPLRAEPRGSSTGSRCRAAGLAAWRPRSTRAVQRLAPLAVRGQGAARCRLRRCRLAARGSRQVQKGHARAQATCVKGRCCSYSPPAQRLRLWFIFATREARVNCPLSDISCVSCRARETGETLPSKGSEVRRSARRVSDWTRVGGAL